MKYHCLESKILIIISLLISMNVYSQSKYSLETELPTLQLTYNEFWDIIEKINPIICKLDTSFHKAEIYLDLSYNDINEIIKSPSRNTPISLKKAYNLTYSVSNYNGSITNIEIHLRDFSRSIKVSGNDIIEIQSIVNNLENEFSNHSKLLVGPKFRIFSWICLLISSFFLMYSIAENDGKLTITSRKGLINILGFALLPFSIFASWGIFDLSQLFPGFVIYNEQISFISKYADYFTFWGFVLSTFGLIYTLMRQNKVLKKSQAKKIN